MTQQNLTLPQREPVAVIGAVAAALGATLTLAAHWAPISDSLKADVTDAFSLWALALCVLVPVIRQAVTPNAKVVTRVDKTGQVVAGAAHGGADGSPVDDE